MRPKIFINIGLPKTSSTNLQLNFYPYIKNINYLGRSQSPWLNRQKKQSDLFKELNIFIEGGEKAKFTEERLEMLQKRFKNSLTHQINLISMENWAFPYQKNTQTNKIEIVSQFEKLLRLKKFAKSLDVDYSFFLVHRDPAEAIISLFITAQNRIERVFGAEFLELKKLLHKYENKDEDYENIKLFFDVYNIKKLKEIFFGSELKIFKYNDIKIDPKKFIDDFYKYLRLETDFSLLKNVIKKTGVTPTKNGNFFIKKPNFLFLLFKKLIPQFILNKIKPLQSFPFLKKLLVKDQIITQEEIRKLKKILAKE